jgi:hypothetical protein
MNLFEAANELVGQSPLPNDTIERLDQLAEQAQGQERLFIQQLYEAAYAAATAEQLQQWQAK